MQHRHALGTQQGRMRRIHGQQFHVFGHVHEGHGSLELRFDEMQKNYEAAVSEWKLFTMVDQPEHKAGKYIPQHLHLANLRPFPKLPGDKQMIEDGLL
jgi:hypothetical protein